MIQAVHTIKELEKNRKFRLESDHEIFTFSIPEEFIKMKPGQLWLLSHQITAFGHNFGLDNGFIIENENLSDYKFRGDRKVKHQKVKREWQKKNLMSLVTWFADYKTNWNNYKEYDCHPQSWDEFMDDEKTGSWEERIWILFMIVLLQDVKCENVQYERLEKVPADRDWETYSL